MGEEERERIWERRDEIFSSKAPVGRKEGESWGSWKEMLGRERFEREREAERSPEDAEEMSFARLC